MSVNICKVDLLGTISENTNVNYSPNLPLIVEPLPETQLFISLWA